MSPVRVAFLLVCLVVGTVVCVEAADDDIGDVDFEMLELNCKLSFQLAKDELISKSRQCYIHSMSIYLLLHVAFCHFSPSPYV